jgi:hypothetical protein
MLKCFYFILLSHDIEIFVWLFARFLYILPVADGGRCLSRKGSEVVLLGTTSEQSSQDFLGVSTRPFLVLVVHNEGDSPLAMLSHLQGRGLVLMVYCWEEGGRL